MHRFLQAMHKYFLPMHKFLEKHSDSKANRFVLEDSESPGLYARH